MRARALAVPGEPPADRCTHLEGVADHHVIVEERRHLTVGEPLDRELDHVPSPGGEATEYERCAV